MTTIKYCSLGYYCFFYPYSYSYFYAYSYFSYSRYYFYSYSCSNASYSYPYSYYTYSCSYIRRTHSTQHMDVKNTNEHHANLLINANPDIVNTHNAQRSTTSSHKHKQHRK